MWRDEKNFGTFSTRGAKRRLADDDLWLRIWKFDVYLLQWKNYDFAIKILLLHLQFTWVTRFCSKMSCFYSIYLFIHYIVLNGGSDLRIKLATLSKNLFWKRTRDCNLSLINFLSTEIAIWCLFHWIEKKATNNVQKSS